MGPDAQEYGIFQEEDGAVYGLKANILIAWKIHRESPGSAFNFAKRAIQLTGNIQQELTGNSH